MATVADTRLVTADEFQKLELDVPVELVRGEIVEMTRPGARHGRVCIRIGTCLENWANTSGLFAVLGNDTGFVTTKNPDSVRGPDVLVIRRDRLPGSEVPVGWLTVAPDLAIEVLSPHDRWPDVLDKTAEYLAAGTSEVWVIDPEERTVHLFAHESGPRKFTQDETLASESLLPGFSVEVSRLFEGV